MFGACDNTDVYGQRLPNTGKIHGALDVIPLSIIAEGSAPMV